MRSLPWHATEPSPNTSTRRSGPSESWHSTAAGCAANLGEALGAKALKNLQAMDNPENIPELDRIGRIAGKNLVKATHFVDAFDTPARQG